MSRSYTSFPWCLHGVAGQIYFTFMTEVRFCKAADRFEVLTAEGMNMTAFWNMTSCSPVEVDRRLRGAYSLQHQGTVIMQAVGYTPLKRRSTSTASFLIDCFLFSVTTTELAKLRNVECAIRCE
jgi:hypothetical protein